MATAKKTAKRAPKPRGYNFAAAGQKKFIVPIISAVGQAGVKILEFVIGYSFKVTKVETYCLNRVATITADVKVKGTSVLQAAAAFAPAATTNAPLTANQKLRGAGPKDTFGVFYTSDGTGALTNGFVIVTVEPT